MVFIAILDSVFWASNSIDRFRVWVLVHEVNSWPVSTALSVSAGLVFFDSPHAFLLSVSLLFAEIAIFVILVHFVSAAWASSFVESGSGLVVSSAGGIATAIALRAWLVCLRSGPSSNEKQPRHSHRLLARLWLSLSQISLTVAVDLPLPPLWAVVATWYIFLIVIVSWSCWATTDLSSGVSATLNRFILKKLNIMVVHCFLYVRNAWLEIPLFRLLSGSGVIPPYSAKLSLFTWVVLVILVRSSFVVSLGFMARLANPSRMSLSLVWSAFSCLKMSLKSDHKGWSCSSPSQSTTEDSHFCTGLRSELAKW